jgi:hypothetical protein
MRIIFTNYLLVSLTLILLSMNAIAGNEINTLSKYEYTVLRICEGVVRLFQHYSEEIWPGYSLATSPFIVYIPGNWALLLNGKEGVDEFTTLPPEWPDLGTNALFHEGHYRDFVGQLVFDVRVGDISTLAIGLPDAFPVSIEHPEAEVFAYIAHEAFHQYQREAFGEIPWEREEKYPTEDVDNSALAYLEMLLLENAIEAMAVDDLERCRKLSEQFVAVRYRRWKEGDPFVAKYEQGKELLEGTAKYVEFKCLGLAADLEYLSALDGLTRPLIDYFFGMPAAERILDELENRMGDGFIPIEDLSRNRIYPVGCAQGFLLDYFNIDWKASAQRAGPGFSFARCFKDGLDMDEKKFSGLMKEAKDSFDFKSIFASSQKAIEEYRKGYGDQLKIFEDQPGVRFELEASSNNVIRSRVSRAKKWIVEKGSRCLRSHYEVYTLRGDDWSLDLHDAALLELEEWDAKRRKVVFYVPEVTSILIDGRPVTFHSDESRHFQIIEMNGENFQFNSSQAGVLMYSGNTLKVTLPSK